MQSSSHPLLGKYGNELNSTFWIDYINEKTNALSGRYSTGAGRPSIDEIFNVSGTVQPVDNGVYIISWNVNWQNQKNNYKSIACWNGFANVGKDGSTIIHTNWLLNHMDLNQTNPDTGASLYDLKSSRTGSNTFNKVNEKYLDLSNSIWDEKQKEVEEKFNKEDYNPKISVEKSEGHEIVWMNYGTILTTMLPAEKWPEQEVSKNRSFVFQAAAQTQGRGQNTNTWASPPGNVYLTAVAEVDSNVFPVLPLITSSAIIKTINEFLPDVKVNCKWVNDIFIQDAKVSGLLTKCDVYGQKFVASFGIGVNINEAPLQGSTCLNKFSENKITVAEFSKKLICNLLKALKNKEESFERYKQSLVFISEPVKVFDVALKEVLHEGVFKGINEYGNAILVKDKEEVTVTGGRMRLANA